MDAGKMIVAFEGERCEDTAAATVGTTAGTTAGTLPGPRRRDDTKVDDEQFVERVFLRLRVLRDFSVPPAAATRRRSGLRERRRTRRVGACGCSDRPLAARSGSGPVRSDARYASTGST